MPKGFAGIRDAVAEIEARKQKAQEGNEDFVPILWWKLPNSGDSAIIRPLEEHEDVAYAAIHKVKIEGRQYDTDIICRDQDRTGAEACPGCEAGLKRGFKGWLNIIWRDAPDFPTDENGKFNTKVDYASIPTKHDKLAVLSSGSRLFDRLADLNEEYDGLCSRDFTITRSGTGLATTYKIIPVKGQKPGPLNKADKELAADKFDLSRFLEIPSYEDWQKLASGSFGDSNGQDETPVIPPSPFGTPKETTLFG